MRERAEDIGPLTRHFLALAVDEGLPLHRISADAVTMLETRPWRGNVRELRNAIYRLAVMSREDVIDGPTVDEVLGKAEQPDNQSSAVGFDGAIAEWMAKINPAQGTLYHGALAAFEKPLFIHALGETAGNQVQAAKLLGINRNTLRKRLVELEIDPEQYSRRK